MKTCTSAHAARPALLAQHRPTRHLCSSSGGFLPTFDGLRPMLSPLGAGQCDVQLICLHFEELKNACMQTSSFFSLTVARFVALKVGSGCFAIVLVRVTANQYSPRNLILSSEQTFSVNYFISWLFADLLLSPLNRNSSHGVLTFQEQRMNDAVFIAIRAEGLRLLDISSTRILLTLWCMPSEISNWTGACTVMD